MDYSEDFTKLRMFSPMAKEHKGSYEVIDYEKIDEKDDYLFTFHPNGVCGCMLLDDDYAFGIRCDHFMWAEGNCEGVEGFWNDCDFNTDSEDLYKNFKAILIYGNHKGSLYIRVILLHETEETPES
jgi:hypothetical protein